MYHNLEIDNTQKDEVKRYKITSWYIYSHWLFLWSLLYGVGLVSVCPIFSNWMAMAITLQMMYMANKNNNIMTTIYNICMHGIPILLTYKKKWYDTNDLLWQGWIFIGYLFIIRMLNYNFYDYYSVNILSYLNRSELDGWTFLTDYIYKII